MSRSNRSVHALHRPISERYTVRGRGECLRISPEDGLVVPRLSLLHYRSSLLDPRSSGRNNSHRTLLKMAQTNQLPVIPRTEDRGNENSRPEKDPRSHGGPPEREGLRLSITLLHCDWSIASVGGTKCSYLYQHRHQVYSEKGETLKSEA